MSVNNNVVKEIHRNHEEETDIKLKTEKTLPMRVCMYQQECSESALQ